VGNVVSSEINDKKASEKAILRLVSAVCVAIDLDNFCGLEWIAYHNEHEKTDVIEIRPAVMDLSDLMRDPETPKSIHQVNPKARKVGRIRSFDLETAIQELREIYDSDSSIPFSFYCGAADGGPNFSVDGTVKNHAVSIVVFDGVLLMTQSLCGRALRTGPLLHMVTVWSRKMGQ
jgi:hypothetical protein